MKETIYRLRRLAVGLLLLSIAPVAQSAAAGAGAAKRYESAAQCVARLMELAGEPQMPPYEGEAEQLIDGRLLWHNAHNPCAVDADDQQLRMQLFELAKAWRLGKEETARGLLGVIAAEMRRRTDDRVGTSGHRQTKT